VGRRRRKGSLPTTVPTDPLIYRCHELVNVYGTTFKELIHEEFGDGIMSAIDFKMDVQRDQGVSVALAANRFR
jgi:cyanate lyase